MYIGTSIFLIALGAILKFAVTATVAGVDIQTVGVILMVVGALALVISLMEQMIWATGVAPARRPLTPSHRASTDRRSAELRLLPLGKDVRQAGAHPVRERRSALLEE